MVIVIIVIYLQLDITWQSDRRLVELEKMIPIHWQVQVEMDVWRKPNESSSWCGIWLIQARFWGENQEPEMLCFFFGFPCDSHGFWERSFYWLMTAAVVVFHRWWSKEGHVWGFLARSGPLEGNHCDWPGITCWGDCGVEKIECENCSGHLPEKIELRHLWEAALVKCVKWLSFFFIPQRLQNHGGC